MTRMKGPLAVGKTERLFIPMVSTAALSDAVFYFRAYGYLRNLSMPSPSQGSAPSPVVLPDYSVLL